MFDKSELLFIEMYLTYNTIYKYKLYILFAFYINNSLNTPIERVYQHAAREGNDPGSLIDRRKDQKGVGTQGG